MTKIHCTRKSCEYCFGETCGKGTVKINSDGCQSFKDSGGCKESAMWSTNPWGNYLPPIELVEEYRQRARILLKEDKISNNDVNQDT